MACMRKGTNSMACMRQGTNSMACMRKGTNSMACMRKGTNSMACMRQGTNSMACVYFTEFAENGSIYDYIHKEHKKPPLSQMILWAVQVAEGMYLWTIKGTKCCLPRVCCRGIVVSVQSAIGVVFIGWLCT